MGFIKKLAAESKIGAAVIYLLFCVYSLIYSLCFLICHLIFPVKKDKVVGCNMKGKRYGDNPKYIMDAMIEADPSLEYVWLLNEEKDAGIPENVRIARRSFFREIYELATAAVWIDSNAKQKGFLKWKNQLYVQTWHGSYGLKKIGRDLEKQNPFDRDNMKYNFDRVDITVSNSARTSELFRTAFGYNGKILEYGSPRNDIFFRDVDAYTKKVKEFFRIEGKRIALYAPTFRSNFSLDVFDLDYERLASALQVRFGGEWVVLIRLHPNNMKAAADFIEYNDHIINATSYDVMQELLVASDVMVTDYSSCMFDFVTTGKTCFLYVPDAESYKKDRDYYYKLEDLPFPMALNNDEMTSVIREFDREIYDTRLRGMFEMVKLCETGHASEKAAEFILDHLGKSVSRTE